MFCALRQCYSPLLKQRAKLSKTTFAKEMSKGGKSGKNRMK